MLIAHRAGVLGLTAALRIQQHLKPSQSILIVARDFPTSTSLNYTSPWAGAHYRPVPSSSEQFVREARQALRTYEVFKQVAAEEPAAGVKFVEGVEHLEAPTPEYIEAIRNKDIGYAHLDGFCELSKEELPSGVKLGVRYQTYCLNPPVYCAHLLRKFVLRGGETTEYTLARPLEAFELASAVKAVVNCSGMGFSDTKSFIIRGTKQYRPIYQPMNNLNFNPSNMQFRTNMSRS
jgi:D-amino-acid oxidase